MAMIASLEPVESVTTVAVTPRLSPLIVEARSFKLSPAFPLPRAMVTGAPVPAVRVKDDVGRVAVALVARSEYHDPVLAKLLTTTVWLPATVPAAAVAVTSAVLEDVAVRCDRGPFRLFNDCKSVVTAVVAVWIAVREVVWPVSVV